MASSSSVPAAPNSAATETRTPISAGPAAQPSATQPVMHKNQLQEFAQKSNIALPMYQTVNEGHTHAPKFRATVWVDGMSYTSPLTFPQRKPAEQEAAKLALECLATKIREEGHSLVCEIATFCKAIMNEYAVKLSLPRPTFNTVPQEGLIPGFISSLVFNGTSYTGDAAKSKKDAEQLAARAAILSLLGNSDSGIMLFQIIKTKSKLYDATKVQGLQPSGVSPVANTAHTSVMMDHKDKEVADPVGDNKNEDGTKVEFPESHGMLSPCQQAQVPKQESTLEATQSANESLQPGIEHPIVDGSSSKKRRKNKKKPNKKARMEAQLSAVEIPTSEVTPCSVAQLSAVEIPTSEVTPCSVAQLSAVEIPTSEVTPCSVAQLSAVEIPTSEVTPCSVAQLSAVEIPTSEVTPCSVAQ